MIFVILGAGRFGSLALERLARRRPRAEYWVVDRQVNRLLHLPLIDGIRQRLFLGDAIAWLEHFLNRASPTWIIPAIPEHVAWLWLSRRLPQGSWRPEPVPKTLAGPIPWVSQGLKGELYLSLATDRCPDDCPETVSRCFLTRQPRLVQVYHYLESWSRPEAPVLVVRSRQLAPGIGGYQPAALQTLAEAVARIQGRIYVATACRCHGVVHGLLKFS